MVNLKHELKQFREINISSLESSLAEIPDDIKKSIVLYNKAIDSLVRDSEDIAIIELKKAVSLNPNFSEAINLLGLCYLLIEDAMSAEKMFDKVIDAEYNGVKAMAYKKMSKGETLSEYDIQSSKKKKKNRIKSKLQISQNKNNSQKLQEQQNPQKPPKPRRPIMIKSKPDSIVKSLVWFTSGLIIGALILFVYAYPSLIEEDTQIETGINNENNADITTLDPAIEEAYEERILEQEEKYNELLETYNTLEDDYNTLDVDYKEAIDDLNYFIQASKLHQIEVEKSNGNIVRAAELLESISKVAFVDFEKTRFEVLKQEIYPEAANLLYQQGRALTMDDNKHVEALTKLLPVYEYMPNFHLMDALLYFTGRSYQFSGNHINAKERYLELLDKYPESYYVQFVNQRLSEMD